MSNNNAQKGLPAACLSGRQGEAGISIYLVVMVMSLILGIALGINGLLQTQIKASRDLGYSMFALDAADAGIEKIFYDDQKGTNILAQCPASGNPPPLCTGTLSNGATYKIWVQSPGAGCSATTYCVKSSGTYTNTVRTLRIAR